MGLSFKKPGKDLSRNLVNEKKKILYIVKQIYS